ncbi:hypothetical protein LZ554_004405 [Drepanopeziza brunnea f. sp. 'monogermtubi']|nr:hypothetical protein LZ554_004405 [Drepanopeziza brunnea f. sp. 'monogermtubi']
MGTPFITFLGPSDLSGYNRKLSSSEQPDGIPQTFIDAMEVREQVFVEEQKIPFENEFDADDHRSCHWVIYASVNTVTEPEIRDSSGRLVSRKKSVTRSTPIGTVRLVPFPHPAHPEPGSKYSDAVDAGANPASIEPPPYIADRATTYHDGREPYLKLGRLAVLKEFRRSGIAKMLVGAAMAWAQQNPTFFNPSIRVSGLDKVTTELNGEIPVWRGLLCVHAQKQVQKTWEKWGFKLDEGMEHLSAYVISS